MKAVFIFSVVLGSLFGGLASLTLAHAGPEASQKVSLKIEGMTCGNCVKRVSAAICDLPGIVPGSCKVEVGSVNLELASRSQTSPSTIEDKIKELNYKILD